MPPTQVARRAPRSHAVDARATSEPRPPLRFVVGTSEISGYIGDLAEGLTRLGHHATTAISRGLEAFADAEYDLDISADTQALDWPAFVAGFDPRRVPARRPGPRASPHARLAWLVAHHDAFVFMYSSLWHDAHDRSVRLGVGREFQFLRALGKRVAVMFVGPDSRHAPALDQELAHLGARTPAISEAVPYWGAAPLSRPLRNLRRAERFADAILSQPNQASLALRPYTHLFAPIDLRRHEAVVPGREVPVVVHAPSFAAIKGTAAILASLDRLRARGVRFELKKLEDVPNAQVLEALRDADVVIDQLLLPLHGRLGLEAMAAGCALVTRDDPRLEPYPADRPIWNIDAADLDAQLERILTDRALRLRLARDGVAYVRAHHDHTALAARVVAALDGGPDTIDHRPEYFARHYTLPPGARVPVALKRLTRAVVAEHGLPAGVTVEQMAARGLL